MNDPAADLTGYPAQGNSYSIKAGFGELNPANIE